MKHVIAVNIDSKIITRLERVIKHQQEIQSAQNADNTLFQLQLQRISFALKPAQIYSFLLGNYLYNCQSIKPADN